MPWSLMLICLIALCNANPKTGLKGETSQSSNYTKGLIVYSSERAINGDNNRCAHTDNQMNSWWRIDLLGVYRIDNISIFNQNHHNSNITGAQIYIGNSREKNGTTNHLCTNITNFQCGEPNIFKFDSNVSGRYITVFIPKIQYLILCDVKIYGTIKESPFKLIRENKTWGAALDRCRDQDMILASIVDGETQTWAELEAKNSSTPFVWLGLRYTCTLEFWFWVENLPLNFNRWVPNSKIDECDMSGAMQKLENYSWFSKPATDTYNFICAKRNQCLPLLGARGNY